SWVARSSPKKLLLMSLSFSCALAMVRSLLLYRVYFLHPFVVASAFVGCVHERLDAILRHLYADDARAQRQYVRIVMLAGQPCHRRIRTQRRTYPFVPVGGQRDADARAADGDAALGLFIQHGLRHRMAEIGIVAGGGRIGAEIDEIVLVGIGLFEGFL